MSLNPTGAASYGWNYSNPQREGYSEEMTGTVVALQEVQAREFSMTGQPGRPRFWPDGNPVMNIRVAFATQDGSLKHIIFQKAGKRQVSGEKPSLHMQLFGLTNGNMMELMGKTVYLKTWPAHPETGQRWGQGNPRLFVVTEVDQQPPFQLAYPLPEEYKVPQLLANDGASGGQPVGPAPQQVQVPQQVAYQQPQAYQPQPVQQVQQPVYQQPVQQVQQPQPVQQAATAQMPEGMDPVVAQAMQQVGAMNVQPVTEPYGEDANIPF